MLYESNEVKDLLRQARQARSEDRIDDACHTLVLAAGRARRDGSRLALAQALRELGEAERRRLRLGRAPDPGAAQRYYEEAVAVYRELDEPLRLAHTLRHLGDVYREAGRPALASPCYDEALAIYRGNERTDLLDLANAIRSLAVLEQSAGRAEAAGRLWREAHDLYAAGGVAAGVAEAATHLGTARVEPPG